MTIAPSLSIVIPTFNRADYLKNAIESALAQTVACEIVVVDHGSSDATPELAASYGNRIVYVRREADDGPCIAWFDGILRSRGDYIHLTFDDDWIAPDFAERTLEWVSEDVSLVFTNVEVVKADSRFTLFDAKDLKHGRHPSTALTNVLMNMTQTISPGCAVFRRRDALDALMMNPTFPANRYHGAGPDVMMFLLPLSRRPYYVFIDAPLAFFRSHDSSITMNAFASAENQKKLCDAYAEYKVMFLVGELTKAWTASRVAGSARFLWKNMRRFRALRDTSWFGKRGIG